MPGPGGDGLASATETLAGLAAAARAGGLDDTAALTALAATRRIAAELERSELALIEAARDGGRATHHGSKAASHPGNHRRHHRRGPRGHPTTPRPAPGTS
jgi:hypothetical protein